MYVFSCWKYTRTQFSHRKHLFLCACCGQFVCCALNQINLDKVQRNVNTCSAPFSWNEADLFIALRDACCIQFSACNRARKCVDLHTTFCNVNAFRLYAYVCVCMKRCHSDNFPRFAKSLDDSIFTILSMKMIECYMNACVCVCLRTGELSNFANHTHTHTAKCIQNCMHVYVVINIHSNLSRNDSFGSNSFHTIQILWMC